MPVVGAITLYVSLLTFTLRFHPDRLDYVDQVLLGSCVKILSNKPKLEDSRATKQVVALLSAPLEKYSDIFTSLTLSNYPRVMDHLDSGTNKIMAMVIIQSIMTNQACVSSVDKVDALFELTKGLIKDLKGDSDDEVHMQFFTTFSVATKSRFRQRMFLIKGSRIWLLTWTRYVRYVMTNVFGDPKHAPPLLEQLSPKEVVSHTWKGEGSFVKELIQCIAPHLEDGHLTEVRSSIRAHDPSSSDDVLGALRKSLIW
ncbi:putative vacuolar protein sorting-associated protein [Helianthus annuus]|uniref:Vacuolar protein sorting-associated protein n=1 Tax=Helianthus annuus TaxID=4232 RepID=A0A9K3JVT9_HELAN|nr:putative vacuolar protein sorting-associated protein [Helianthus annuus]